MASVVGTPSIELPMAMHVEDSGHEMAVKELTGGFASFSDQVFASDVEITAGLLFTVPTAKQSS
jgi:hypothetical protein